jgi:stage III sporulation protein AF
LDVLTEIVKNLLVIIIVSSFLELLLPEGNVKPFVRLAIGLFVIIAVLSPSLTFLYDNPHLQVKLWDYQADEDLSRQIEQKGRKLSQSLHNSGNTYLKDKIAGQISAVALLVPGVDDVHTSVLMDAGGNMQEVKIVVKARHKESQDEKVHVFNQQPEEKETEQKEITAKIMQILYNFYDVDSDRVEIEFEGG